MRQSLSCVGVLLALLNPLPGWAADWPQLAGNAQRTGYSPEMIDTPVPRAWAAGFAPERLHPQAQPVICQGRLFIGTEMGTFHAFDAKTGRKLWTFKAGGPILHTAGAAGDRVYLGCMDGCIYALNAADGTPAWKFDSRLRTGFSTAVLLSGDALYLANRGGVYYALSRKDGAKLWEREIGCPILMSNSLDDGRLFFGAMDMRVYALDAASGQVLWKSEALRGAAFKDYWPVAYKGYVLIRPARDSGGAYGKAIEWSRGPLPASELAKQDDLVKQAEKDPSVRNLFVLDQKTGKEAMVLPQWVTNTMNGATTPPCVDGDGMLIVPVTLHDWRGGWGRLDLARGRVTEVLCDGDFVYFKDRRTMRGTGNTDENLGVSAAGRLVLTFHTEESNAHFTGIWHLDRRDWLQVQPIHVDRSFTSNTQGGGGNPPAIADGMIFHTSWNTLNARTTSAK